MREIFDEDIAYAQAHQEALSGAAGAKPGLWARAFSEAEGVESKAVALYIKLRVESLKQEVVAASASPLASAPAQPPAQPQPAPKERFKFSDDARREQSAFSVQKALSTLGVSARKKDTEWIVSGPTGHIGSFHGLDELVDVAEAIINEDKGFSGVAEEARRLEGVSSRSLINGDYGLAYTYWCYGVLGFAVLKAGGSLVFFNTSETSIKIFVGVIAFAYWVNLYLAVSRAAARYSGPSYWANLAKFAVIVNVPAVLLGQLLYVIGLIVLYGS